MWYRKYFGKYDMEHLHLQLDFCQILYVIFFQNDTLIPVQSSIVLISMVLVVSPILVRGTALLVLDHVLFA